MPLVKWQTFLVSLVCQPFKICLHFFPPPPIRLFIFPIFLAISTLTRYLQIGTTTHDFTDKIFGHTPIGATILFLFTLYGTIEKEGTIFKEHPVRFLVVGIDRFIILEKKMKVILFYILSLTKYEGSQEYSL